MRVAALTQLGKHSRGFIETSEQHQTRGVSVVIRTLDELPATIAGTLVDNGPSPAFDAGEGDNEPENDYREASNSLIDKGAR